MQATQSVEVNMPAYGLLDECNNALLAACHHVTLSLHDTHCCVMNHATLSPCSKVSGFAYQQSPFHALVMQVSVTLELV